MSPQKMIPSKLTNYLAAYIDKLTKGPPIKAEDCPALQWFLILLTSCKNTLMEIGYLNKVENPDTLKMVVNRLPYGLKLKWCDVADRITKIEEWEITIGDMGDFDTSKVCAATHTIFGNVTKDNPVTTGSSKFRNKPPSRASNLQQGNHTPVNGNNQKCPLCNARHWLSLCDEFKKKSLKDLISTPRTFEITALCLATSPPLV